MHNERKIFKKYWLSYGYGKRLALGFSIDKYSINIDFFCFWVGVEF
jgi:hypothetical protein